MSPDTFIKSIKKENIRLFITAFATGLIIHGFRLTNHLLTWDSAFNFHDPQVKIALGRWFLSAGCALSSFYDIQWMIGLLSLTYLSVSCILLVCIFDIKGLIPRFLTCALVMSFPSVASTFAYMYTADGYMLALLLATLAVYLAKLGAEGFTEGGFAEGGFAGALTSSAPLPGSRRGSLLCLVASAVLIALSAGMYQAYFAYAVMLILTFIVLRLLFNEKAFVVSMFAPAPLGVLGYFACSKAAMAITGTAPTAYNGISDMGAPGALGFIDACKNCLIDTAYFFYGPLDRPSAFRVLNLIVLVITTCLTVRVILASRLKAGTVFRVILGFALMPFACFMIYFISPGVRYYMLMNAPLMLIYLLPVILAMRLGVFESGSIASWAVTLSLISTIFNFALIDNISYLYMVTDNQKTLQFAGRVADRIEELPDLDKASRLCVIGHLPDHDKIELMLPPAMAGIKDGVLISDTAHFTAIFETYFGLVLEPLDEEESTAYRESPQIREMPVWPSKGSAMIVGDTVVVRLGE